MAARRLIIVLIVLFVASVIAAAIAPERQRSLVGDETTSTTTDATTVATTTEDGTSTQAAADPDAEERRPRVSMRLTASESDPGTGKATVGQQVELIVRSHDFQQLEIPAFGMTGNASPNAPARFSLLLRDAGEIPILAARTGNTVARLVVAEADATAASGTKEKRPESTEAGPGR